MANWRRPFSFRPAARTDSPRLAAPFTAIIALLAAGCGHAGDGVPAASPSGEEILCAPADEGQLHARLQGSIDAEIDWSSDVPQCLGGPRPDGDGVRLLYKGRIAGDEALLIVIGIAPLRAGESARNVPVNLTVVREGTGEFFATQGRDKCALDEVHQEQLAPDARRYRLTGRGYCTQPARALSGDGAVLMSRFDVVAIVDYR
jgi:hypothetical protein